MHLTAWSGNYLNLFPLLHIAYCPTVGVEQDLQRLFVWYHSHLYLQVHVHSSKKNGYKASELNWSHCSKLLLLLLFNSTWCATFVFVYVALEHRFNIETLLCLCAVLYCKQKQHKRRNTWWIIIYTFHKFDSLSHTNIHFYHLIRSRIGRQIKSKLILMGEYFHCYEHIRTVIYINIKYIFKKSNRSNMTWPLIDHWQHHLSN